MKSYYTEKEYRKLLKQMVILHAGNERVNKHITDVFDMQKVEHNQRALKTGDYSFMIKACPELGFYIDTYYTDELCIERKANLSELAGNIANQKDDGRIFKEFNRMINIERSYLLIEDDSLEDLYNKNYISDLNSDSYLRTLLTWQARNNMHIYFVKKESMAKTIYEICKNCLDSKILKGSV
jgi:ERCC4-type nuclease